MVGRNKSVSIVAGYGLEDTGSILGTGVDFSLHHHANDILRTPSLSCRVRTGDTFPIVKRLERETDRSALCSA